MALLFSASTAEAARIWLIPNAKLIPEVPLLVELAGVQAGENIKISIQQDCSSGMPQLNAQCPALWGPVDAKASAAQFSYSIPAADLANLPSDRFLWVVAESDSWKEISRFHNGDPCALYRALFDSIFGGICDLKVAQVLRDATRSASSERPLQVEVFTFGKEPAGPKRDIPGTRGATGFAWANDGSLLVTTKTAEDTRLSWHPVQGDSKVLWKDLDRKRPATAPFVLPDGQLAMVRQKPGPQMLDDPENVAELLLLSANGEKTKSFELRYKIHQWLKVKDNLLIGVSLGLADAHPQILSVDLQNGHVEKFGFANELYLALLREPAPNSKRALAAWSNRAGYWEISLVEAGPQKDPTSLLKGDRDYLAPAWKPGGGEFAYLAGIPAEP